MPKFNVRPNVGDNRYYTYKAPAAINDNDIGKPVKIDTDSTVALCADGDQIYGFIAAVEPALADGLRIVSVQVDGRLWVILDGASAVGTVVEAAANTAAGVAKAGAFGLVSTHAIVLGTEKLWKVVAGAGGAGDTVVIEKQ